MPAGIIQYRSTIATVLITSASRYRLAETQTDLHQPGPSASVSTRGVPNEQLVAATQNHFTKSLMMRSGLSGPSGI